MSEPIRLPDDTIRRSFLEMKIEGRDPVNTFILTQRYPIWTKHIADGNLVVEEDVQAVVNRHDINETEANNLRQLAGWLNDLAPIIRSAYHLAIRMGAAAAATPSANAEAKGKALTFAEIPNGTKFVELAGDLGAPRVLFVKTLSPADSSWNAMKLADGSPIKINEASQVLKAE